MERKVHVRDILRDKHPPSKPAHQDSLSREAPPYIHPVVFDSIDKNIVKSEALKVSGAGGPSGLDAYNWRRYAPASDLRQLIYAKPSQKLPRDSVPPMLI